MAPQLDGTQAFSTLLVIDAFLARLSVSSSARRWAGRRASPTVRGAQRERGVLIGGLTGLVGGVIGLIIGELVYQPLAWLCFVGRALAWGRLC